MLVECNRCNAIVDAEEHGQCGYTDPEIGDPERYTLVSCPKCHSPMLAYQQLIRVSQEDYEWLAPFRLYPRYEKLANYTWPQGIQDTYTEAATCYNHKAYTASAIMCRKILEATCIEHGYTKGDLNKRLAQMKDDGIVESRLFEWADQLRILGNQAAHGVNTKFSGTDARDILDFTEAILEYVFTFRDKFDKFRKRRAAKAKA